MWLFHRPLRSLVVIALAAMVLGGALALVKGRDYGLGYFVGNLSTPYLFAAFFGGRVARGRIVAGLIGVLMTWAMLGSFYLSAELAFGYPTGSMTRFYAEWFLAGAFSGTALGLLGQASHRRAGLLYVLPFALVVEPLAVVAVQFAGRFGGLNLSSLQVCAWAGEMIVGCLALAILRLRSRNGQAS